jgi:hypothetical protein
MIRRILLAVLGVALAAGLFTAGRLTAPAHDRYDQGVRAGHAAGLAEGRALQVPVGDARTAYQRGYEAGANDVFEAYDGGWYLGSPYLIVLAANGQAGITYRIDARTPLRPGVNYYLCPDGRTICQSSR